MNEQAGLRKILSTNPTCSFIKDFRVITFFLSFQEGSWVSDILQYVELDLWSTDQCNKAFENTGINIDPTTEICAYEQVILMKFLPNS